MNKKNRCALLIPHYQDMAGLLVSLASIGRDEKIDVFVVDDGSSLSLDETTLLHAFKAQGKVYFIYLPHNQGIQFALNQGLAEIGQQYDYIARLDCGDICAPERFFQQMEFLDQHPDIALVGSAVTFTNTQGHAIYTLVLPADAKAIRSAMHNNCAFIHPSVMWRTKMAIPLGNYPLAYPMAEDFAFFWRFVRQYNTANMREVLVYTQINPKGLSMHRRQEQLRSRLRLQCQYFNWVFYGSYVGVLKTLLLMLLPYRWVLRYKQKRYGG